VSGRLRLATLNKDTVVANRQLSQREQETALAWWELAQELGAEAPRLTRLESERRFASIFCSTPYQDPELLLGLRGNTGLDQWQLSMGTLFANRIRLIRALDRNSESSQDSEHRGIGSLDGPPQPIDVSCRDPALLC
jgi:hypothetical protein